MELEMDVEDLLNKRKLESDRIEFKTGWTGYGYAFSIPVGRV